MARLRQAPGGIDPPVLLPPPTSSSTSTSTAAPTTRDRTRSPRKIIHKVPTLSASPSKGTFRYAPVQIPEDSDEDSENDPSFMARTITIPRNIDMSILDDGPGMGTPRSTRSRRVLRPVASNSLAMNSMLDGSYMSPERQERRGGKERLETERERLPGAGVSYSKGLARMMAAKKGAAAARARVVEEASMMDGGSMVLVDDAQLVDEGEKVKQLSELVEEEEEEEEEVEAQEDIHQSSIICYDEEADIQAQIWQEMEQASQNNVSSVEDKEEDEEEEEDQDEDEEEASEEDEEYDDEDDDDEDPVVNARYRRPQAAQVRQIGGHDEDDYDTEEDEEADEEVVRVASNRQEAPAQTQEPEIEKEDLPPVKSLRPPDRKGRSTISNWAQDVIDLTDSPPGVAAPPPLTRPNSLAPSTRPMTASSSDGEAILSYSPTPTKQRSPRKSPPIERPSTPPLSQPRPTKLVSPSKKKPSIPHAPNLRPSLDAFWCPAVVNDWNETHSPAKPLVSPRKQKLRAQLEDLTLSSDSDASSISVSRKAQPPTRTPAKKPTASKSKPTSASPTVAEARARRKAFADSKHALAEQFLAEVDTTITGGRIASLSANTGGITLIWSKTLKTTAGRANWRREQLRLRTGSSPTDIETSYRHHCSIELAEKVIDDEERLCNVIAHEYCHLTTFMIDGVRNNPHGAEFKAWARRVSSAFSDRGVEVTTKHSYEISYKYVWECVQCGYAFKRHSKSVDPARHSCGKCKGRLVQTKPTPRGVGAGNGGKGAGTDGKKEGGGKSEYQLFVKANYGRVKQRLADEGRETKLGSVMAAVGEEYRRAKKEREEKTVDEVEGLLGGLKI